VRTWRVLTKSGREVGLYVARDEWAAVDLAVKAGKVKPGEKGLRVLPHVASRGPIVTMSAAVIRLLVLAPAPERYRKGGAEEEAARFLVVAAEPPLEQRLQQPLADLLVPRGRVDDGPSWFDHGSTREAAVLKFTQGLGALGVAERLRLYVVAESMELRDALAREALPVAARVVREWNADVAQSGYREIDRLAALGRSEEDLTEARLVADALLSPPAIERGRARVNW
jgi:hypothetical protein